MSGFDSSDEETSKDTVDRSPFNLTWFDLPPSEGDSDEGTRLAVCGLPGCRFKDTWRDMKYDIECLKSDGIEDIFCLCTRGELGKYRVPKLLTDLADADITVHHFPFPDGTVPSTSDLLNTLDELKVCVMKNKKTVINCYGGLGRSCFIAGCLMMTLDESLVAESVIEKIRELRGPRAIQTVKQYNLLQDFHKTISEFDQSERRSSRSLSR